MRAPLAPGQVRKHGRKQRRNNIQPPFSGTPALSAAAPAAPESGEEDDLNDRFSNAPTEGGPRAYACAARECGASGGRCGRCRAAGRSPLARRRVGIGVAQNGMRTFKLIFSSLAAGSGVGRRRHCGASSTKFSVKPPPPLPPPNWMNRRGARLPTAARAYRRFWERFLTRSSHTSATNCFFLQFLTFSLNFSRNSHRSSESLLASVGGPGSGGDGPGGGGERQPARWGAKRRSLTRGGRARRRVRRGRPPHARGVNNGLLLPADSSRGNGR